MGELRNLRKRLGSLNRKVNEMDAAYERLQERYALIHISARVQEVALVQEVKQWRDKYVLVRSLYDKLRGREVAQ